MTKQKQRTTSQNKSIHLLFRHLADQLNEAGLDVRTTLKEDVEIPWNEKLVKEIIFKGVLKAYTGKDSTTQMTTKEVGQIFEIMARHLSQRFGLVLDFPNLESLDAKYQGLMK